MKSGKDKIFQPHEELTPLSSDQETWKTPRYWGQLKNDLNANFSRERFAHIQEVAEVYSADRLAEIRRKQAEEAEAARKAELERRKQQEAEEAARKAAELRKQQEEAAKKAAAQRAAAQPAASGTVNRMNGGTQYPKAQAPGQQTSQDRRFLIEETPEQKNKRQALERRNLGLAIAAAAVILIIVLVILLKH